jgi:hypothetical protein
MTNEEIANRIDVAQVSIRIARPAFAMYALASGIEYVPK